jgi:hypothetical protein
MTSDELLAKLHRDIHVIIEFAKEFEFLPESTLNWKERNEKSSILECLEHLNRYSLYYNLELRKRSREQYDRKISTRQNQPG